MHERDGCAAAEMVIVVFVVAVVVFGQLRTLLTHGRTRAYKYNYATCIVCAQQHTIL